MTVFSGWDYPDFRDEEPPEDREFWEDDVPDHWWAASHHDCTYEIDRIEDEQ